MKKHFKTTNLFQVETFCPSPQFSVILGCYLGWTKGRSRISGKGVHMYKGVCVWGGGGGGGVRFADFISYFFNIQ